MQQRVCLGKQPVSTSRVSDTAMCMPTHVWATLGTGMADPVPPICLWEAEHHELFHSKALGHQFQWEMWLTAIAQL